MPSIVAPSLRPRSPIGAGLPAGTAEPLSTPVKPRNLTEITRDVFESVPKNVTVGGPAAGVGGGAAIVSGTVNAAADIKDQTTLESVLRIEDDLEIAELELDLDLQHSYRGDLRVTLVSPKGTRAVISDREGGGTDDLKLAGFDLTAFKGESTQGNWTLIVQDTARRDEGVLSSWGLHGIGAQDVVVPVVPEPNPEPAPEPTPGPAPEPAPHGDRDPRFAGLADEALWRKVGEVAGNKTSVSYNNARKVIFTDIDNHDGVVTGVYTKRQIRTNKIPSNGDMNVEHTWPQSKGATGTAKSDLHHLFPTDSKANSVRGNHPFGEVSKVTWTDAGGHSRAGKDASGKHVFEPVADHRGNVARAMFYFSAVYKKHIDPAQETVLKKWNLQDPPDAAELARNSAVEHIQRNRNPFVDDFTLANNIRDF